MTGSNRVWIAGPHADGLPDSVLFATVTRARELFNAGRALTDPTPLRKVIDLPADLDAFGGGDRKLIDAFLKRARALGTDKGTSLRIAKLGGLSDCVRLRPFSPRTWLVARRLSSAT